MPRMNLLASAIFVIFSAAAAKAQIWPSSIPGFQSIAKDGISEKQAEYVAALTAKHEKYQVKDRHASIERLTDQGDGKTDPFPGFFYFTLSFNNTRSLVIFNPRVYYISKVTGDVWEGDTPSPLRCRRVSFPALTELQSRIMTATGATFASEAAQRAGLGCAED